MKPIDLLTVTEELRQNGKLELTGGAYYLSSLTNRIVSAQNIKTHALIIVQKFVNRELIRVGSEVINDAYDDTTDTFELLDRTDNSIIKVRESITSGGGMKHISDFATESTDNLLRRERMAKEGFVAGVPTGIKKLDKLTAGWQNGDLIILASRPGMGKTASMLSWAKAGAKAGKHVNIYSLEMQGVSLYDRLILSEAEIDADKFKNGYMSESDWTAYDNAQQVINNLPIYVDDKPIVSMNYIRANSRLMKKKGKCDIIFADYLQLADMRSEEKGRNREQEVSQATRQAKLMAKELNVPFVLLSQLNRESEKMASAEHKPNLSQLRESGAIEQDADIVVFVFRPAYYEDLRKKAKEGGYIIEGIGEFIIAKHRNGQLTDIHFKHNENITKIFDCDEHEVYSPIF